MLATEEVNIQIRNLIGYILPTAVVSMSGTSSPIL